MEKDLTAADKTRQAFIEAFCLLYNQKPIEKITVQEIAKKAGYNRSTFYQYFLDIDDLLDEVENTMLEYICEKRGSIDTYGNSFVSSLVDLYETKAVYVNAVLGDFGSHIFVPTMAAPGERPVCG